MVEPFRIQVPDSDLADLRRRLGATRLPAPAVGESWESGVDYGYLADLIRYWGEDFDWRAREEWLNSFPQFTASVAGAKVHFVHLQSGAEGAIPIVLSHGWPYTFAEMLPIVPWLTDPVAHDGPDDVVFDVVVPSLPGYGFSEPLAGEQFTADAVARVWHELVTGVLGYERYATYGEDVGAGISDWLGALYRSRFSACSPATPPSPQRCGAVT